MCGQRDAAGGADPASDPNRRPSVSACMSTVCVALKADEELAAGGLRSHCNSFIQDPESEEHFNNLCPEPHFILLMSEL